MIRLMETNNNYLYIEVEDKISKADVTQIIPKIEAIIKEFGKIRSLIVLKHITGHSLNGLITDVKFFLKHWRHFSLIAIVGDKKLGKILLSIVGSFLPGKTKYFDISELESAKEWIKK